MADERTFTLVGNFKDNITPSLKKLNSQLAATTKSFEKMQKMVRPIAKDMAIMGEAASRMTSGMSGQRNAFETNLRAMKSYRSELGKISSAQRQMERKFKVPGAPFAPPSSPRGGRPVSPRSVAPEVGDGFTIEKGVLANLATNFVTGLFNQISNAVGKSINFVKGAIQERIDDEMGDIQSAGGILSIGKEKKVPWADTYQEAFTIQKKLNAEMANLAAALPGETGQYVANMKQVTDTVMKVTTSNGPAMIKAMQGFNSSVKSQQDAYVEATKQLAKYTTLASLGQEGGVPITALAEQMLNADKVNIQSLKRTYAGLQKNPLVSGALEKYEKEMNKAAAGSAERYTAMLKAFEQAFPVEVLDAMTNSADGIIQGLKSGLLNPDTGLFGLGRAIQVNFAGLNRTLGPAMEQLSVFDMFLQMFKAFGMLLGPIVSELPKIIEPFKTLMDPLKQFYVIAENTIGNFKTATKKFGDLKLSFPAFRGSLDAIGKLAKSMGANEGEFKKLEGMLGQKNLNLGAALQQAVKTLMSSDFFKKIGKAFGESLSGFLSMLAGLAEKGGALADQSGVISGFLEGWRKNNGTQAIMTLISKIMGAVVKGLSAAALTIIASDPINAAVIATVFFAPVRGFVLQMLGTLATQIGTAIMGTQLAGTITATIAGWAGAIIPTLAGIGTTIATTVAGWAGAIIPAIASIASGLMTFFTVTLPAVLAPLLVPALIVGAIIGLIALIYKFKDQIMGAITALQGFIASNFSGGFRDFLLGITQVWKSAVMMITGLVDVVMGFFTGDKERMAAGFQGIRDAAALWMAGMKQAIVGAFTAIINAFKSLPSIAGQVTGMLSSAVMGGIRALAGAIGNAIRNAAASIAPGAFKTSTTNSKPTNKRGGRAYDGNGSKRMPLGSAIASEMRNKPSGSHLVIANSSETVIPAAGGYGAKEMMETLKTGFSNSIVAYGNISKGVNKNREDMLSGFTKVDKYQTTTTSQISNLGQHVASLAAQVKQMGSMGMMGGMGGGGGGGGGGMGGAGTGTGSGYGSGGSKIAGALGTYIKQTGGAPGSIHEHPQHGGVRGKHSPNSYHYQGRAIDIGAYANEQAGVMSRIAQFNAKNGVKPVEWLHARNASGHNDHVHVAYALGKGNPALFASQREAIAWEKSMMPGNVKVGSVTGNSAEGFGGSTNVTNNITIQQQPGQSADDLAMIVAQKIGEAVADARAASILV